MKPLLAAIFLLTLASCRGTNRGAASGDEEKFARVYAMLVITSSDPQAASRTTPEQILADAGMTQEEFRKTVADFNRDPQRWGSFIKKVEKIVEKEIARPDSISSPPGATAASPSAFAKSPVDTAVIPRQPASHAGNAEAAQGLRQPSR